MKGARKCDLKSKRLTIDNVEVTLGCIVQNGN